MVRRQTGGAPRGILVSFCAGLATKRLTSYPWPTANPYMGTSSVSHGGPGLEQPIF
jgi:hypothetical protein